MADKKTTKEERAEAADKVEAVDSFGVPIDKEAAGGEAFAVDIHPERNVAPDVKIVRDQAGEGVEEQLPTEPSTPSEGTLGQAPVLTPGVYAPISSRPLPNAHRDATALAIENGVLQDGTGAAPVHGDEAAGPRGAYELAKLLEARPHWVNNLDQLDDLERAEGIEPRPWVADPQDLLEEAKRYNFYFIGANGNQIPQRF